MASQCLVTAAGCALLAYTAYKLINAIYNIVFPHLYAVPHNLQVLAGAKWAVVTGGTDGIGKAYAFELAKKGFDLVLIGRTQSKLDAVAGEITQKCPSVSIKTILFDFTNASLEDYEANIFSELNRLEVGALVNNVGMSYEYPERLDKIEGGIERVLDILVANTVPTTLLSTYVLAQMVQRRRGIIVNIASAASYHKMFYWAIYSSTKKYVSWLTSILKKEYEDHGITIQAVCPMLVATKMSKLKKSSFFTPCPEEFAKSAVRTIGHTGETTGCLAHQIQAEFFFNLMPSFLVDKFITKISLQTRARALKKKATTNKSE